MASKWAEQVITPAGFGQALQAPYHNEALATVNDHEIRVSVMTGAFGWHRHPDSDESFLLIEGELIIEFDDGEVRLATGELLTVPAGVRHRTRSGGARSVNLTFERRNAETVFDE